MVTCGRCGATDDGADVPLGWSTAADRSDEVRLLCPDCTRRHVRDIEAKLDDAWWS